MKAKICSLLLVLLVISTGHAQQRSNYGESPWGRIDFMWTNLSAEKCNHVTRFQNNDFRRCPPVAGYQLLFRGNEASPQLIVITPNRKRHVIHYWDLKADNFISLDKQVSWKLARSRTGKIIPLSLMLEVNIQHDEFTRFRGPSTVVVKLTPKEVCVVARIPVDPSSPGYVASISTSARGLKCVGIDNVGEKDWFGVVVGLVEKGQHEEAKSTIKQIQSPATRTVAYVHIARAQAESGDQAAARTTLLQGLDEVLNQKQVTFFSTPTACGLGRNPRMAI